MAKFSDAEFHKVRDLLAAKAGLVFDDSRRESVGFSVGERMRASATSSVDEYLSIIGSVEGDDELQALLNEVTIQETHFFRNPPQFRALRQHVLPGLVRDALHGDRTLRIWSAGCSTGEEPYSVAMILRELLPLTDGWDIRIVATDISTRALDAAKQARYGQRALAATDDADIGRWFVRDGDSYVVRPEVSALVEFRHHNLVSDPPPFGPDEKVDLILCRNVTIYFGRETTRALMVRFHGLLSEGGYLFLGHSETLWHLSDRFRLVSLGDAFVYRRDTAGEVVAGERRAVLPDRRTGDDLPPGAPDRRVPKPDRRGGAWDSLTRPRALPRIHRDRDTPPTAPQEPVAMPTGPPAPVKTPESAMDTVRAALRLGRYEEAVTTARDEAQRDVLAAEPHYLAGLALANLGRDDEALVELRKAVYIDPAAGFAQFLLAGALSRLGDQAGAARAYAAAADCLTKGGDAVRDLELEGRQVQEIIDLCRQLAERRVT